jgi:hypothetical protein
MFYFIVHKIYMNFKKYYLDWYNDVFTETNHEDMNESILDPAGIFKI